MRQQYRDLEQAAGEWMREHEAELIEDIRKMVRIPSVSHPEKAKPGEPFGPECRQALDAMLAMGEAYGFRTRNMDGWGGTISMGDESNAIGIIAHLDVVPVGDGWVYPPFEAVYLAEHDAVIGRGADDNKGPAVAALYVMRMLRDLKIPMRHGVRLYCGVSEENGMMDMAHLRECGEKFPAVSLVPDAGFPVNYGQKGSLNGWIRAETDGNLLSFRSGSALNIVPDLAECVAAVPPETVRAAAERTEKELRERLEIEETDEGTRIRARGVSGHAASPEHSLNAIWLLCRALTEMELLTGSGKERIRALRDMTADAWGISEGAAYEDEISGKTTLVYSTAELTDGVLTVGADCRYSITCPGEELRAKLGRAWRDFGFEAAEIRMTQPYHIPKEDPRVRTLQEVYREVTGREDEPYTMGGGTYSRAVPNAVSFGFGMRGVEPDLSFLPEGHGKAHGRDETLSMEKIRNGMRVYLAALTALDDSAD